MNKDILSKVRRRFKKTGYGLREAGYGARLLVFVFFLALSVTRYPFPASADSITIRTIVTPIGSQSEKWGAKGLMVCVVGESESVGGCGLGVTPTGYADGELVIFEDIDDNHKYDDGTDDIYELGGAGSGEVPEGACMWVKDGCPSGWINELAPSNGKSSKIVEVEHYFGLAYPDVSEENARICCTRQYGSSVELDVEDLGTGGCGAPGATGGTVRKTFDSGSGSNPTCYGGGGCVCYASSTGTAVNLWECKKDPVTYYWCCPSE